MNIEVAQSELISKDQVKPVVAETLRNMARQNGCATVFTIIFRSKVPPEGARLKLTRKNDWTDALRQIYEERSTWVSSMKDHLGQLPTGYTSRPEYQQEMANSVGPKLIQFYNSLWSVLSTVFTEDEMNRFFEGYENAHLPQSYASRANFAVNFPAVQHFFEIPDNPQDQLAVVKELGPQIYKNWKA